MERTRVRSKLHMRTCTKIGALSKARRQGSEPGTETDFKRRPGGGGGAVGKQLGGNRAASRTEVTRQMGQSLTTQRHSAAGEMRGEENAETRGLAANLLMEQANDPVAIHRLPHSRLPNIPKEAQIKVSFLRESKVLSGTRALRASRVHARAAPRHVQNKTDAVQRACCCERGHHFGLLLRKLWFYVLLDGLPEAGHVGETAALSGAASRSSGEPLLERARASSIRHLRCPDQACARPKSHFKLHRFFYFFLAVKIL